MGDVIECRANHLAARMIWTKVFGRTFILVGWWFGMLWNGWSSICSKHPFRQVVFILIYSFLQNHPGGKRLPVGPSPNQQRRPLPILFCLYPSSMGRRLLSTSVFAKLYSAKTGVDRSLPDEMFKKKFNWWRYCLALWDEFSTISLYLTKLYVT